MNLQKQLMLRTRAVGGMGWDVNAHVNLQKQLMLRTPGLGQYIHVSEKGPQTPCSCPY